MTKECAICAFQTDEPTLIVSGITTGNGINPEEQTVCGECRDDIVNSDDAEWHECPTCERWISDSWFYTEHDICFDCYHAGNTEDFFQLPQPGFVL